MREIPRGAKAVVNLLPSRSCVGEARKVIFVTGVQRSGTNMVMNVLDRSFETDVFHEIDRRAYDNFALAAPAILKGIRSKRGAPFLIFKCLLESHNLKKLLDQFPNSNAIWVYRNYSDQVNSHMASWSGCRETLIDIVAGRRTEDWRVGGLTGDTFELVKAFTSPDMTAASAVALFWLYRNRLFFDQGLDHCAHVQLARYENLVADPSGAFGSILSRIGITYTPHMTAKIYNSSIGKKPRPDIEPGLVRLCDEMMNSLDNASLKNGGSV